MKTLPHYYQVTAIAGQNENLELSVPGLPNLEVAPPRDFDGPGDVWSPEDLLLSSVASCTVLSFRAIARAARFEWLNIICMSEGVLERIDKKTRFTRIHTKVQLRLPLSSDKAKIAEKATKLLFNAEESCLVSNSLSAQCDIECEILFGI